MMKSRREVVLSASVALAMFYKLDEQGLAPQTHYVGAKRLISGEADRACRFPPRS